MNDQPKPRKRVPRIVWAVAIGLGLAAAAFLAGRFTASPVGEPPPKAQQAEKERPQKKPTFWTCSMHPQFKLPKPGLCPICNMPLIPLKEEVDEEPTSLRRFVTSKAARKLMEIETSPVERKFVTATIRMVGKVDYDETKLSYITAWVPGRIDRLYVDYTGVAVRKGHHMVYLYSPELYAAQEELLQAIKAVKKVAGSRSQFIRETTQATVEAAREKLRLWGLEQKQVDMIEKRGTASDHLTIYAPTGGIVIHRNAQEGMYVRTGTKIYTIADLRDVWVKLDAYESDLQWLRYGQRVDFMTEAYPGETFQGTIAFIAPVLNAKTRTVKVRVNVPNKDGRLKPEMFVRAEVRARVASGGRVMEPDLAGKWMCPMHPEVVEDKAAKCRKCQMPLVKTESLGYVPINYGEADRPLVIPASAPLITGTRAIVYIEVQGAKKPTFEGREIVLGPRAGDYYLVRHGLEEHELVVTMGNFKIDSSLQILAKPSMMTPSGGGAAGGHHHGGGAKPKRAGAAPMMMVPMAFRAQLPKLQAAQRAVRRALGTRDLDQTRTAFKKFGQALDQMDASALNAKMKMAWKELAMRLKNDSVVGGEVKNLKHARREANTLKEHFGELQAQFAMPQMAAHEMKKLEVPPAFTAQLGKVLGGYLAIGDALAKDDLKAAAKAVEATSQALEAVDMKLLKGEAHMAWMRELPSLRKGVEEARKAKDIEELRAAFALLSEEFPSLVRLFGLAAERPLHILKCPMAFNSRGARWLQTDKAVRNPYFGTAMPQCGDVIDTLTTTRPAARGERNEHP